MSNSDFVEEQKQVFSGAANWQRINKQPIWSLININFMSLNGKKKKSLVPEYLQVLIVFYDIYLSV